MLALEKALANEAEFWNQELHEEGMKDEPKTNRIIQHTTRIATLESIPNVLRRALERKIGE